MSKLREAFEAWVHPLWDTATREAAFIAFRAGWEAGVVDAALALAETEEAQ